MRAPEIPTLRSQTPRSGDNHKAAGIIRNAAEIRIVSVSLCLTFWIWRWPFSISNHVWLRKWDSFVWFCKATWALSQWCSSPPFTVIWFLLLLPTMFCCASFLRHLKGKLVTRLTFPSFFPSSSTIAIGWERRLRLSLAAVTFRKSDATYSRLA